MSSYTGKPGGLKEKPSLPAVMPVGRLKLEGIRQPFAAYKALVSRLQQVVKRGLAFKLRLKVSDHLIEDGRNDWNVQLCHENPQHVAPRNPSGARESRRILRNLLRRKAEALLRIACGSLLRAGCRGVVGPDLRAWTCGLNLLLLRASGLAERG